MPGARFRTPFAPLPDLRRKSRSPRGGPHRPPSEGLAKGGERREGQDRDLDLHVPEQGVGERRHVDVSSPGDHTTAVPSVGTARLRRVAV